MEANSVEDVLKIIRAHFTDPRILNFGLFFRGQENYTHKLVPSVFRQGKHFGGASIGESNMYQDFRLLRQTQDFKLDSVFEWLILMQHYGLPTRLLDWSQNLLVGLNFAVQNSKVDGALFVLEPISMNNASDSKLGEHMCQPRSAQVTMRANLAPVNTCHSYLVSKEIQQLMRNNDANVKEVKGHLSDPYWQKSIQTPIAVMPPMQNERIFLQKGVFTLHGGKVLGNKVLIKPTLIEELKGVNYRKILILAKAKENIRAELRFLGISEASLFPELDYQSKQIRERWTKNV